MSSTAGSYFRVYGNTTVGERFQFTIKAAREGAVKKATGVPDRYIKKVTQDALGAWNFSRQQKSGASYHRQALFLNALAIAVSQASGDLREKILKIVLADKHLICYAGELDRCSRLTDYLIALKIHPVAVQVASIGEKTGDMYRSLVDASELLTTMSEIKSKLMGPLAMGGIYSVLGFMLIVGFSILSRFLIDRFTKGGMNIKSNVLTDMFYFLGGAIQVGWPLLVIGFAMLIYYRKRIFKKCMHWPVVNSVTRLFAITRATTFSTIFLRMSQLKSSEEIVTEILKTSNGVDRDVYLEMHKKLGAGKNVVDSFKPGEWPTEMFLAFNGIESVAYKDKEMIVSRLKKGLDLNMQFESKRLTFLLFTISMTAVIVTLLCVIIGVWIPMTTPQVSL